MQEIRKCTKLKALWLNENPVLGKRSELSFFSYTLAIFSLHTSMAIQGPNRAQFEIKLSISH